MIDYPPIPTEVESPGGTVRIEIGEAPVVEGAACDGLWDSGRQVISLDGNVSPRHQWRTYYHELTHVALTDAGLDEIIDPKLHEAICQAVATARLRERFG